MKHRTTYLTLAAVGVVVVVFTQLPPEAAPKQSAFWQELASPGDLSRSHAGLTCNDCHTAVSGAERTRCVVCHANNQTLLSRQPTSFHAHVSSCKECHTEHQGPDHTPSDMSHTLFARLARRSLESSDANPEANSLARALGNWKQRGALPHAAIDAEEALLDCGVCHSNEDRHRGLFGKDCQLCHGTRTWTLPEFQHPSPRSKDCNQCHQAPPSHYMMHFKMVSARVARKPHARVEQCQLCHETTSWNDIVDVGWYKHH